MGGKNRRNFQRRIITETNYKGETSTAIHENTLEVREEACTRMTTAMRTSVGPSS